MFKDDLRAIIKADSDLMTILAIIDKLQLKDAWLAAGAVRNAIWNSLSGRAIFDPETDLDLVFFDPEMSYEQSLELEQMLNNAYPAYQWEVRNQVYMHSHNPKTAPYKNTCDAISKYPERCTAIGLCLDDKQEIQVFAPYGLTDIVDFTIRPTPHFLADPDRMAVYRQRLAKKDWLTKWPNLRLVDY